MGRNLDSILCGTKWVRCQLIFYNQLENKRKLKRIFNASWKTTTDWGTGTYILLTENVV